MSKTAKSPSKRRSKNFVICLMRISALPCIDHHRQIRCGLPEVIFCPGKSVEQIVQIFQKLAEKGNNVLATRAEPAVFDALSEKNSRRPDMKN